MGVTPIYGFPYPALTDAPNGPAQIQALAEAVEADLAVTDANIATINTTGLTYTRVIGGKVRTTNASATSGTTELQVLDTGSLSLPASSRLRIDVMMTYSNTVVSDDLDFRIRDTNTAGTLRQEAVAHRSDAVVPYTILLSAIYTTTTSETKTFIASAQRITGTGTVTVQSTSYIVVSYLGATAILTNLT